MNCSLCAAYLALKNNVKSQGVQIPYCVGCRPRGKQCALLKKRCPRLLKSEIKFCFECTDFPCAPLKTIDKRYRSRYHMSMIENLNTIKQVGIERFLAEQEQKWKCSKCGQTISCHNGLCFICDLEKLKAKKQKTRWEETDKMRQSCSPH